MNSRAEGVYTCGCCNSTLFHSSEQFDSGRGYLSFVAQSQHANVGYKHHEGSWWQHPLDTGLHCEKCGAHLGIAKLPSLPPCITPRLCAQCTGRLKIPMLARQLKGGWRGCTAPLLTISLCAGNVREDGPAITGHRYRLPHVPPPYLTLSAAQHVAHK